MDKPKKYRSLSDVYLTGESYQHEEPVETCQWDTAKSAYSSMYTEHRDHDKIDETGTFSTNAAEFIRDLLVKEYADKFGKHSEDIRVKQKEPVDPDDVVDILLSLPGRHDDLLSIDNIKILSPGESQNKSGSFPMIKFTTELAVLPPAKGKRKYQYPDPDEELEEREGAKHDTVIYVDFSTGIIIAGKPHRLPDPVKESMPGIMFNLGITDQLTGDGQEATELLDRIIDSSVPIGISPDIHIQCMDAAKYFKSQIKNKKLPAQYKNQINDAISVSILLHEEGFTRKEFVYEHSDVYEDIRRLAKGITGGQEDIWNPSDIYIIPKHLRDTLLDNVVAANVNPTSDSYDQLNQLNALFAPEFDPESVLQLTPDGKPDHPILGVSLKQEAAQAGKAKSFLVQMAKSKELEINMTKEEREADASFYRGGIASFIPTIIQFLDKHKDNVTLSDMEVVDSEFYNKSDDVEWLKYKYGALKLLNYILSFDDPGFFRNIALESMKIADTSTTPAFFKVVGSSKGSAKVETQQFSSVEIEYPVRFRHVFSLTYMGASIFVPLHFISNDIVGSEDRKTLEIMLRRQGPKKTQVEVDGKFVK